MRTLRRLHARNSVALDLSSDLAQLPRRADALLEALDADLLELERGRAASSPGAQAADPPSDAAWALGVGYVFEGSALGAATLLRDRRAAAPDVAALRYLTALDADVGSRWRLYQAALDALGPSSERAVQGALATFHAMIALLREPM